MRIYVENINVIEEGDLTKMGSILIESIFIKRMYKKESVIAYKEDMLDGLADLLRKILIEDSGLSKDAKLNVINLLDKLKTQKENLEILKSQVSAADIQQASERLSKKSQSAFELK
jgi:hypothetical protein